MDLSVAASVVLPVMTKMSLLPTGVLSSSLRPAVAVGHTCATLSRFRQRLPAVMQEARTPAQAPALVGGHTPRRGCVLGHPAALPGGVMQ